MSPKWERRLQVGAGAASILSGVGLITEQVWRIGSAVSWPVLLSGSFAAFGLASLLRARRSGSRVTMRDKNARYRVRILNENGDAEIERKVTFVVAKGVITEREHLAFSDGARMQSGGLRLEAWDGDMAPLRTRFTVDQPTRKRFAIVFGRPLRRREEYTYSYRFVWAGLFPNKEDYYVLTDTSQDVEFNLEIPRDWGVIYVHARVYHRDGHKDVLPVRNEARDPADRFTRYVFQFLREQFYGEMHVEWEVAPSKSRVAAEPHNRLPDEH